MKDEKIIVKGETYVGPPAGWKDVEDIYYAHPEKPLAWIREEDRLVMSKEKHKEELRKVAKHFFRQEESPYTWELSDEDFEDWYAEHYK